MNFCMMTCEHGEVYNTPKDVDRICICWVIPTKSVEYPLNGNISNIKIRQRDQRLDNPHLIADNE